MFGGGYVARKLGTTGETDDSVLDEGSAKYLREMLLELLVLGGETDGLDELKATHQWSGIWGTSKDLHPWVGEVPDRLGVWLAGGYSGVSSSSPPPPHSLLTTTLFTTNTTTLLARSRHAQRHPMRQSRR